jgi:hypothetical protein
VIVGLTTMSILRAPAHSLLVPGPLIAWGALLMAPAACLELFVALRSRRAPDPKRGLAGFRFVDPALTFCRLACAFLFLPGAALLCFGLAILLLGK